MCELVTGGERPADRVESVLPRARKDAGAREKGAWRAVCTAVALMLALAALAAFSACHVSRDNRSDDERLATNFRSHEAGFDRLAQMLIADYPHAAATGRGGIDLAAMTRLGTNAARFRMYRCVLQQISVADLRYLPDSGKLVLLPEGRQNQERPSTSYFYAPHVQSQSLLRDHGYSRRGPGMYDFTDDRPLRGSWFIHHDVAIKVAIAPF